MTNELINNQMTHKVKIGKRLVKCKDCTFDNKQLKCDCETEKTEKLSKCKKIENTNLFECNEIKNSYVTFLNLKKNMILNNLNEYLKKIIKNTSKNEGVHYLSNIFNQYKQELNKLDESKRKKLINLILLSRNLKMNVKE